MYWIEFLTFYPRNVRITPYYSFIYSKVSYCVAGWGNCKIRLLNHVIRKLWKTLASPSLHIFLWNHSSLDERYRWHELWNVRYQFVKKAIFITLLTYRIIFYHETKKTLSSRCQIYKKIIKINPLSAQPNSFINSILSIYSITFVIVYISEPKEINILDTFLTALIAGKRC